MSAAALFLHLTARGLTLAAEQQPEHPDSYVVRVWGIGRLDPDQRERARWLLRTRKAPRWARRRCRTRTPCWCSSAREQGITEQQAMQELFDKGEIK